MPLGPERHVEDLRSLCCTPAQVTDRRIITSLGPPESLLTEHPDVTGGGEAAEVDGLGGHPFDGEAGHRGFVWIKGFAGII